jgi:ATP-binding cassette subfamily F protein 3
MSLLTGEGVLHGYTTGDVLDNISFALEAGDRVGLVGRNGSGKTTLLRLLAGELTPMGGNIRARSGLRVGYLPQVPPDLGGATLWELMLEVFSDLRAMATEMDELAGRLAGGDGEQAALARFGRLQEAFEAGGGYGYEVRIKSVLTGLGFDPAEYGRPLTRFSGGQRTRANLARILLTDPDLLLLDEPTNHLDLDAVEWLERFLQDYGHTLVVVSHDRWFLDRVTNRTWEIAGGRLDAYRGNYSAHLRQRNERMAQRWKTWETQQEYIRKTEEYIRRVAADKSRARQAHGRRLHLERFLKEEAIAKPGEDGRVHIELTAAVRSGDIVLRAADLAVGYQAGSPLLTIPKLDVHRGERIGIVGGNGSGKTTLLRTLLGELEPLDGRLQTGAKVHFGYLPQVTDRLDPEKTVLETVLAAAPDLTENRARTLLGGFLFSGDDVFKRVGQLSGGERSRVLLARLAARGANTLMLDEPTNHLDIPSQEVLQEGLGEFAGTAMFVSHDRYLIDALATQVWAIHEGRLHVIRPAGPRTAERGPWSDYLAWRAAQTAEPEPAEKPAARPERKRGAGKADRERRKQAQRLERKQGRIEEEIHALEAHLSQLSEQMSDASLGEDLDAVHRLATEYEDADAKLKGLWVEWEKVSEELEALAEDQAPSQ